MHYKFAALLALGLFLATTGTVIQNVRAQQVPAGSNALYVEKGCYACHGFVGQGGTTGPRLSATRLPIAAFTAQLRTPASEMPAYSPKVLSDAQIKELYDFVKALPAD